MSLLHSSAFVALVAQLRRESSPSEPTWTIVSSHTQKFTKESNHGCY